MASNNNSNNNIDTSVSLSSRHMSFRMECEVQRRDTTKPSVEHRPAKQGPGPPLIITKTRKSWPLRPSEGPSRASREDAALFPQTLSDIGGRGGDARVLIVPGSRDEDRPRALLS